MRKAMTAAVIALGLGLAASPVLGNEDGGIDNLYQDACDMMSWQFESAISGRSNHPNFQQALALRDHGVARCGDAVYDQGSAMLRAALQMIGVAPLN